MLAVPIHSQWRVPRPDPWRPQALLPPGRVVLTVEDDAAPATSLYQKLRFRSPVPNAAPDVAANMADRHGSYVAAAVGCAAIVSAATFIAREGGRTVIVHALLVPPA
jgi:hypothetical protein